MKPTAEKITVYTSRAINNQAWFAMFNELWQSRELIWRLMIRDFSVRYRQSIFGYLWAVLPQIVTVAIFTFLSRHRVFDMGETALPYVIHALWSISVWQLFSSCLVGCTNSLVNAGSLVTKINFPKEALVIAAVGQGVVDFLIRLLPVIIVFIWFGFTPSWHAIAIPLVLLAIILMAVGVGFFMAIINLVLRDAGNAISMLLTFGMFLAPILYPPPVREPFDVVNYLNPFSPLLITTQNLLAGQDIMFSTPLIATLALSVILFFVGWRVFHITMPRVAERA
jgi:homopolymeric O-antigen transport system permease protein